MPKLLETCLFCNKSFEYYFSEKKNNHQKYCSNNCRITHKKQQVGMDKERTCSFCSAQYFPKYNIQHTCSPECAKKSSAKNREKFYTFSCKNCGKDCESKRKTRTTYCSQECYFELIGERAEAWKAERICTECGTGYNPSYKMQKYCDRSCAMLARGKEQTEQGTELLNCDWCKNEYVKRLSQINEGSNFCSTECFHFSLRDGENKMIEKECKNCKEKFEIRFINREQQFCSQSCAKSGEFHHYFGKEGPMKGLKPWTYGLTKETDERIANLGEKVSKTHKEQFREGIRSNKGENNPNWKIPEDRISPMYKAVRQCEKYKNWRLAIFKRDNFCCVLCKKENDFINADHIKPFAIILYENNIKTVEDANACQALWNLDNGRTLCLECHKATDTYAGQTSKLLNELKNSNSKN